MKPDQIISLMKYPGADNTMAMGDHADHIHVGYRPVGDDRRSGRSASSPTRSSSPASGSRSSTASTRSRTRSCRTTPSKASIKVTPKRHGNAGRRAKND